MPDHIRMIDQHKFEVGDTVYEVTRPQQLMRITRQDGFVYYCRSVEKGEDRVMAYMERDLKKILNYTQASKDTIPKSA